MIGRPISKRRLWNQESTWTHSRLDDIEPGVPSDWVRAAADSNYEAWFPTPTEAGQSQRARASAKEPEGAHAKRRAQ